MKLKQLRRPSAVSHTRNKGHYCPPPKSVHVMLSKIQNAYSVFLPGRHNHFPLFDVIFVLSNQTERSNSPRGTPVNLKATFERLRSNADMRNGVDSSLIDAFMAEFEKPTPEERPEESTQATLTVSEESLRKAGFSLSSAAGFRFGISGTRSRTTTRQLRVQEHVMEAYQGRAQLQTLIWRHAQPVFLVILEELHNNSNFPSALDDRGLLGVVTARIVSTVGVSKSAGTTGSASVNAGDEAGILSGQTGVETERRLQEDYHDLYGVSGLHFIVFPVECIRQYVWRIYGGISVCDSEINEDDESFTQDTRNRDSFYRAQKWLLGEAELLHGSDSHDVSKKNSMRRGSLTPSDGIPSVSNGVWDGNRYTDRQHSLPYVDVARTNIPVSCVDVDIRPFLNEFARKQCKLASYYRKTALGDFQKLTQAVHLLRSALGKFCFESTVRAIYDLSGCYFHGLGVNLDLGTAKLLRYVASGLRRSYNSRALWLNYLALELSSYRRLDMEREILSLVLFSRLTLTSPAFRLDDSHGGDPMTPINLHSEVTKKQDASYLSRLRSLVLSDGSKLRKAASSLTTPPAREEIRAPPLSLHGSLSPVNSPETRLAPDADILADIERKEAEFTMLQRIRYRELHIACWGKEADFTKLQRIRYQELHNRPDLLLGITYGFTRKLLKSDKQAFIDELLKAGRRKCERGDETSAIDEVGVVHIALSYKHANTFDKGGTIDYETAKEAYEIIRNVPSYSYVRVWIDQNLHRYPRDRAWYQRGFLPYAVMTVVSALGKRGGFAVGCKRPWIWVETGLALNGLGIHCKPDICSTIKELIMYPHGPRVKKDTSQKNGIILETPMPVIDSVSEMLRSVSWWTPDMLSHSDYEYARDFKQFAQWAKAQIVRLKQKRTLDLSPDGFEDTILENISWMKSLPYLTSMRQQLQIPYLRVEIDIGKARKQLALLQVSGKCRKEDDLDELVGKFSGLKTFCFKVSHDKLLLNLNPSPRTAENDIEGYKDRIADFEAIKTSQGGYSLWDKRFPPHELPRFINCGTIFGRHYGMRHRLGEEDREIELGGLSFTRDGFSSVGFGVEGVYICRSALGEIYLRESDVLCIRELSEDLQKELIMALSPEKAFPSMARILKAESDITNVHLMPRTIGTTTAYIEFAIWNIEGEVVDDNEVNMRRLRLGERLHVVTIADNRFGKMVFTFETTIVLETSLGDLLHFKTEGDIDMTLLKVRLMMGSDEFSGYAKDGLSLGIGVSNGTESYPREFRLEGSEFMLCDECNAIYSPINLMVCVLSSNLHTRKIKARWGDVHRCSGQGRLCNIIGTAE